MATQKQSTKPSIPNLRPPATDMASRKIANKRKREILIDDEFKSLNPPLIDLEFEQLEKNLKRDGCRDPLVVWRGKNLLIDGHNRFAICEREGIPYNVEEVGFESHEEACDWICKNQLGRRNLNPVDASRLRGKMYNGRKKSRAEAGAKGGASKAQSDPCLESTAEIVAKETGVSAATIKRDGKFADALDQVSKTDPSITEKVRSGKVKKAAVLHAARATGISVILDPVQSLNLIASGGSLSGALPTDEQRTIVAGGITAVEAADEPMPRPRPRTRIVPNTSAPALEGADSQMPVLAPIRNGNMQNSSLGDLLARAAGSSHKERFQVIEALLETLPGREIQAVLDRCKELLSERQITNGPPAFQIRRGHKTIG